DRQHLLLAAGQHAARGVRALLEPGKQSEHVLHGPASARAAALHTEDEILAHGERRKDRPLLRYAAEPGVRDLVGPQPGHFLTAEADRPVRPHLAHDGLDGGRPPDPVAAEQADDLALAYGKPHALQNVALAVKRVQ